MKTLATSKTKMKMIKPLSLINLDLKISRLKSVHGKKWLTLNKSNCHLIWIQQYPYLKSMMFHRMKSRNKCLLTFLRKTKNS